MTEPARIEIDGLQIEQLAHGPRISQEALALAAAAVPLARGWTADLGTGTGIVALLLARHSPAARVAAVELQPELAALAAANVRRNGLQDRVKVLRGDARRTRSGLRPGAFRLVTANPPYRRPGSGRISPHGLRASAEHELTLDLADTLEAARALLAPRGALMLVHLAERLAEILEGLRALRLEPKRLAFIHHTLAAPASSVLVTARAGARPGLEVDPPIVMRAD